MRLLPQFEFLLLLPIYLILYPQQVTSMHHIHNNFTDLESLMAFKASVSDQCGFLASNWSTNASFCSWIGVSCSLRHQRVVGLSLSSLCLQGTISPHLGNLSFMSYLNIGNNSLVGSIPDTLAQLPRLQYLSFETNQLSGPIPPALFNMSSLVLFSASSNNLTGTLPSNGTAPFFLPRLEDIILYENQLTGKIPSSFASCSNLMVLSLQENEFSGTIPTELGSLPQLTGLYLGGNILTGNIPNSLGNATKSTELALEVNMLEGRIPETLGNLINLQILSVAGNFLTGPIPTALLNLSSMNFLQLGKNNLTGSVPVMLGKAMPNLTRLNIMNLQLNVQQDFFLHLSNCVNLQILHMPGNKIDGALRSSIGNLSTNLKLFVASGNRISGKIPPEIGNLSSLFTLGLEENFITETIPSTIAGLRNLQGLGLNQNRMTGPLPTEVCLLRGLSILRIFKNALSGSIPSCVGNMSELHDLFLNNNRFSSSVPQSLWTLSDLLNLDLHHNNFEGTIPQEVGNLKSLFQVSLSNNRFSGKLPNALGELNMLTMLDISSNLIQGQIPISLGGLLNIEYLNLSHNLLTGAIPNSLGNLTQLKSLDLSFNKLSEQIPQGKMFSNLNFSSLQGNQGLCGAPRLGFPPCAENNSRFEAKKGGHFLKYILPAIACVVLLILVCLYLLYVVLGSKKSNTTTQDYVEIFENYRLISYYELVRATDNFSETNLLGKGCSGSVFKGRLDDGLFAAVKVLNLEVEGAMKSFDVECRALSMARHRNLVKIISTCSNMDFKALVLQFMPNGSLDQWLYSHNNYLNLLQRIDIILGVSSALEYLHHRLPDVIIHCDLKPSNVLLDEDMTAHLSDFGISKLFLGDNKFVASTRALGTIGYMPPEYGSSGKISVEGDIYSFGILLLETFTRKKPVDNMFDADLNFRQWVNKHYPSSVLEIADCNLLKGDSTYTRQPSMQVSTHQCLLSIIELGLICSNESPNERILMKEVVPRLQKIKVDYLLLNENNILA